MTSLDKNLFFQTLLNNYRKRYDEIINNCYNVCVPMNGSYDPRQLDDKFICSHILKPSPLLKSHFTPFNNKQNFHVHIDGNLIKVTKGFGDVNYEMIRILDEEKAYNNANQKYSIFVCEKPLISSLNSKLNYESFNVKSNEIQVVTFDDCRKYLQQISPKTLNQLNEDIEQVMNTYIFLPNYLDDVAAKLKRIIDNYIELLTDECNDQSSLHNNEQLNSAVESYTIGLLYDRLISMMRQRMEKQDERFSYKCCSMNKKNHKIKPTDFGAQKAFENFEISEMIETKFDELQFSQSCTPLAKLNCMRQILDAINDRLKKTVDQHVDGPFSVNKQREKKIFIMSDDLLAAVICSLSVCQPKKFCSIIEFIQTFSWYLPQNSELGYSFVTFKVAKEYILNYNHPISNEPKIDIKQSMQQQQQQFQQQKVMRSRNRFDKELSSLDDEIDKMTELMGKSMPTKSHSFVSTGDNDANHQELGKFLGSLAGNFMTASGQKH